MVYMQSMLVNALHILDYIKVVYRIRVWRAGVAVLGMLKKEMENWKSQVIDLERTGSFFGEQLLDNQRKKLVYYIMKEIVAQSLEIGLAAERLDRNMEELLEFVGEERQDIQIQKKKIMR